MGDRGRGINDDDSFALGPQCDDDSCWGNDEEKVNEKGFVLPSPTSVIILSSQRKHDTARQREALARQANEINEIQPCYSLQIVGETLRLKKCTCSSPVIAKVEIKKHFTAVSPAASAPRRRSKIPQRPGQGSPPIECSASPDFAPDRTGGKLRALPSFLPVERRETPSGRPPNLSSPPATASPPGSR